MTVVMQQPGKILLTDSCPAEDADILLQFLSANRSSVIDWSDCNYAHSAVIQVLMAAGKLPTGRPASSFLEIHLGKALGRSQ